MAARGEEGITIVEVVVAALVLVLGALATFATLTAATVNNQRAKGTQVALNLAQAELEKLSSLSYAQLVMSAAPPHSGDPHSPDYRVVNGSFNLRKEPVGEPVAMVIKGGYLYPEGKVELPDEGETGISPGPRKFESGGIAGEVYRYIVWRDDESCGTGCPGHQDYKQVIVAVKLDKLADEAAERGYVEVQSSFIDPAKSGGGTAAEGETHEGRQLYLTDTPCAAGAETVHEEIIGDHPLHNTLGVCADGMQTGSTPGAPDALLLGPPPDPAPEDPEIPALFDYSDDNPSPPTTATDKGIQIRRDATSGCSYTQAGEAEPQWKTHRWVTDPMPAEFKLSGDVTIKLATRALNDSRYKGKLCVYLFKRRETATEFEDTRMTDEKTGSPYWTYSPSGTGYWPTEWTEVSKTMEVGGEATIQAGDRLGVALSVASTTQAEAIPILYDHPNPSYQARLEVPPTPLEGG